jgi:hypothetical protein
MKIILALSPFEDEKADANSHRLKVLKKCGDSMDGQPASPASAFTLSAET